MAKATLPKEGDKVFIIDEREYTLKEYKCVDAPSEIIWVMKDGKKTAFGLHWWALTKAEGNKKLLALATNRRAELTEKLITVEAVIKKLGGK